MTERRGGIIRENDGDFNPGWLLVIIYALLGAVGCGVIFALLWRDGVTATPLVIGALIFIALGLLVFASAVYSLGRLKVLHGSSVLGGLARALGGSNETSAPAEQRIPRPIDFEEPE